MNVGTLTIEIAANVARLQADMAATKNAVSGAMKDVEQYVGFAKTAFVSLAGVSGVASFAGMIQGAISAKAKLYDLSLQTGISVEGLASLGKVAKYSDTALTDIAGASNKLSKALFTQNEDSQGAAAAIKALGLNFDAFKQLTPDQQMRELAKAMDGFEDGTAKSAAAMLLFGKTGATLLPFMKELAERNGEVSKETTASAKAAKEYEDNLVTLKNAGEEWKKQLVTSLLPALVDITNQLVDGRKAYGGFLAATLDIGVNVDPFKSTGENLKATRDQMAGYQDDLKKLNELEAAPSIFGSRAGMFDAQKKAIEDVIGTLQKRDAYLKAQQAREAQDLGKDVTDRFTPRKARLDDSLTAANAKPEKAKAARDDFTPIMKQIDEKIALDAAELDSTVKLTEAQKLQAKVFRDIDEGYLTLNLAQKLAVDGKLQELLALEKAVLARDAERKALQSWNEEMQRATDVQRKALGQAEEECRALQQQLADYGLTREELAKVTTARLRDAAAALRQQALQQELNPDAVAYVRLLEEQAQQLERNADAKDALNRRDQEAVNRAKRERQDPDAGAARAVREYREELGNMGDAMNGLVGGSLRNLEDGLTDLFTKGKFDAKSFIDTLIREFVRLQVVKPMMAGLLGGGAGGAGSGGLGGFAGMLGSFLGSGSVNAAGGFAGAGFGSGAGFGNMDLGGFFAAGGDPPVGKASVVGERGPELFVPKSAGTIVPNGAMGGNQSISVVQNLSIGAGVSPSQLAQAMRQAKDQAMAEISNQVKRGSRAYS